MELDDLWTETDEESDEFPDSRIVELTEPLTIEGETYERLVIAEGSRYGYSIAAFPVGFDFDEEYDRSTPYLAETASERTLRFALLDASEEFDVRGVR